MNQREILSQNEESHENIAEKCQCQNRNEEYRELMAELELPGEGVEQTLTRARKRKKKRDMVRRPLIGMAACFALFVLLVNFSMPVAYACSQIPILKDLAEAVTFSRSLSDAVENEYVQTINLIERNDEVTAKVEYLIVDQKQINVFYRLYSDVYTQMNVDPRVLSADGSSPPPCSYGVNDWDVPNGELQSITIDFVNEDVPESLLLKMDIRDFGTPKETEEINAPAKPHEDDIFNPSGPEDEAAYVAHFEFLLEFDPEYTEKGQIYEMNETVILEGQKITVRDVTVYPTHLRVNIEADPENTAWLKGLHFTIEMDQGISFDPISNGIVSTGDGSGNMTSFRADSPFFYEAKDLKLVITGAEWLKTDMETVKINLETGETGTLPEGVEFASAEEKSGGWILRLRAPYRKENHYYQVLYQEYYDKEGNEYHFNSFGSYGDWDYGENELLYFIEEVALTDYHETEVWVSPAFSHVWSAEEPVIVTVR